MSNRAVSTQISMYFLWILATSVGWFSGIFDLTDSIARTYLEIVRLIPLYLAEGLLIGMVIGIGQMLILRRIMPKASPWFWATLLGYALAFPTGLLVTVLIPSIAFPLQGMHFLPLAGPSTMTIYLFPDSLFWGGFMVGILQWQVLKQIVPNPNLKKAALWIFASWLGFGLGILARGWVWDFHLPELEMGIMGLLIGLVTGLALLILIGKPESAR